MRRVLLLALFPLLASVSCKLADHSTPPSTSPAAAAPAASAAADTPKPAWDVNAPPYPTRTVNIDVREGTWIDLDVSPDGKTIAFSLLGDLYLLPIGGGDAKSISSGIAWDMQPVFSPDGKKLAFTSDSAGGDNLWTMNVDGSDPKQVSKESYRLVNEPAWDPSGEWIVGRKHFTSRRSLGAGEMWLWHVTGGDGLQMTTKPTDQKDVGEPAFSPDGKYLYYSLDATPGPSFEYSKDSNDGIYAIRRLDRETGDTDAFVTGPGGACRPTPSHDGKSLAFVRRVRFQSTLFVMDVKSGAARPVWSGLERDMQETWAIHGVAPRMAWTPDDSAIVTWAHGKLWSVAVENGKATEIPFHVADTRQVASAVRFPQQVAPDEFDVKALQDVAVSPSGDQVVYSALGHLWTRALPDGTPKRLTSQTDSFEYCPSFSRDGRSIVYVTWNDEKLGTVSVTSASGGDGKSITPEPGIYRDPVFTPDGKRVVYGKVSGGNLTSPLWGAETGVFVIDSDGAGGGKPKLVTKDGTKPRFGKDADRVFLQTGSSSGDNDGVRLVSLELDGSDQRSHLVSDNGVDVAVSPDGKWVAWVEKWNVWISPFVPTGREVHVGPKGSAEPCVKVSKDAGENIQWSGDSKALFWSLGPELYTRKLDEAFAFLAGDPNAKLPEPEEHGKNISFKQKSAKPSERYALVNARIVTMNGDEVVANGCVVVNGNKIESVGAGAAPSGVRTIDCAGKTIIPGMIDVHEHGGQAENGITPQKNWNQTANLAFGVTTEHDPSNDTNAIFTAAELQRAGMILAPRIFSTGTIVYGASGSFRADIDSLDDAKSHLRRLRAIGAFSVKSYNQPRREQRQQIIEAAHELNMMVVPEGGSTFWHNLSMVVDGHTGIEHSLPVESIYSDVTQLWKGSGVGYTPTLIVGYGGIWGENYWYDTTNVWENERLLRFVPRRIVDPRSRRRPKAPLEEYNHLRSSKICKALVDVGEQVQLGAHGQLAGLGAHWELWMLQQGGLTNHQALRAATLSGAKYLGLDGEIGSIEPGKLADLLVLDANPLDDIKNSLNLRYTILNGVIYEAETMARMGEPDTAPHFFFEKDNGARAPVHAMTDQCGCVDEVGAHSERAAYR